MKTAEQALYQYPILMWSVSNNKCLNFSFSIKKSFNTRVKLFDFANLKSIKSSIMIPICMKRVKFAIGKLLIFLSLSSNFISARYTVMLHIMEHAHCFLMYNILSSNCASQSCKVDKKSPIIFPYKAFRRHANAPLDKE